MAVSRLLAVSRYSVVADPRAEIGLGAGIGGGLGLAIRATSRVTIGLESGVDHSWLDRRDDPFRAVRTIDLALIVALRF